MIRYRFMIEERPRGPWRADRRQALQDARNVGMAQQERRFGPIAVTAPGWIENADNLKLVH